MKTRHLLVPALIASLAINIVFVVLFLSTYTCPLEEESVLQEEQVENVNDYSQEELSELGLKCQAEGTWLEEYQECEWVKETWCLEQGGDFKACASACRNMDEEVAQFCTTECVPVCSFK